MAIPLVASRHSKLTVTSVLFQPLMFGAGSLAEVRVGGVLSMFSVTSRVAVFLAISVPVPLTT